MDADEKLTALKKAYADVILGISQEASARVMASDRKSVRYQHELKVAKDEGLRMLLRLKQMMDSRISESQAMSLIQQKKIDELEAQLQEAEDIVSDLRGELQEAQAELERTKNKNYHEPVNNFSSETQFTNNNIYSYRSVDFFPTNESPVASDISAPYPHALPSIILRGKETGLYRNGCTQRIHACDRNRLDKHSSVSEENTEIKDENNGKEKQIEELPIKPLADIKLDWFNSFLTKRRRAVRQRKTVGEISHLSKDHDHSNGTLHTHSKLGCEFFYENEGDLMEVSGAKTVKEETDVEKINGPSYGLELNSSECNKGLSGRPVRERDFKYTFQRKRKRQALSKSEGNGSLETEKKMGNEKNVDENSEEPKRSLSMESVRDSRRLAQVARQLISLSESKWWN